jgi:N-acetylmuramoyl-L-alanine amidase
LCYSILFDLAVKTVFGLVLLSSIVISSPTLAQEQSLNIVFPSANYQTSQEKIFFLGTAPPNGEVFINGKSITRSKAGHFAPSLPLQLGENLFTVRYQNQERQIKVTRKSSLPETPIGLAFAKDSLTPAADVAKLTGELICFSAIAPKDATVSVKVANQTIALLPQPQQAQLPSNLAALTGNNQPIVQSNVAKYEACTTINAAADVGQPQFELALNGKTITQPSTGKIQVLSPAQLQVAEVTVDAGVARTGPSTDYSRLTPLPKGTRATVTGKEGEWLRLDYGAWINSKETRILSGAVPPRTIIRSVGYRQLANATEIVFPVASSCAR